MKLCNLFMKEAAINVKDLKGQTIAFAASGGLDSCPLPIGLCKTGAKLSLLPPISRKPMNLISVQLRNVCAPTVQTLHEGLDKSIRTEMALDGRVGYVNRPTSVIHCRTGFTAASLSTCFTYSSTRGR